MDKLWKIIKYILGFLFLLILSFILYVLPGPATEFLNACEETSSAIHTIISVILYLILLLYIINILICVFINKHRVRLAKHKYIYFIIGCIWPLTMTTIVFPSYGHYTCRFKVSEAMTIGSSLKTPISMFFQDNGRYPNRTEIESFKKELSGKFIGEVRISKKGKIKVQMKKKLPEEIAGKSLIFIPHEGGSSWDCASDDIQDRYLPTECRKTK